MARTETINGTERKRIPAIVELPRASGKMASHPGRFDM
jgi:hypothetical protein